MVVTSTVIYVMNTICTRTYVSTIDIGRVLQAGVTDKSISDVSILSDMIEIRIGLKTCDIFFSYDVIIEL